MPNMTSLKPMTVRLPEDDLSFVKAEAEKLGITAGVYVRILLRQSLDAKRSQGHTKQAFAFKAMQDVLSKAANRQGVGEKDVLSTLKQVRREVAEEQFAQWSTSS